MAEQSKRSARAEWVARYTEHKKHLARLGFVDAGHGAVRHERTGLELDASAHNVLFARGHTLSSDEVDKLIARFGRTVIDAADRRNAMGWLK